MEKIILFMNNSSCLRVNWVQYKIPWLSTFSQDNKAIKMNYTKKVYATVV